MTSTTTCGGPTTSGSTPPLDTGVRRNSPNRDSSSKKPSNTPLPIQGIGETGHAADGQAWPGAPVQERETARLVQGRADQGAEEPDGQGFPRRASEHAVGHGPGRVLDSRGQGLSVARHRLPRRTSRRVAIGTSPNAALANGMLADACSTLRDGEKPIIHSDRGCHYRWPEWIRICKEHGRRVR